MSSMHADEDGPVMTGLHGWRRQVATAYFAFQALAVGTWWIVLVNRASYRAQFALRDAPDGLFAFASGDFVLVVLGSAYVAIRRGRGGSGTVAWIVAGAMLYAALFTITAAGMGIVPRAGAIMMTPAAMATVWAARVLSRRAPTSGLSSGESS